MKNFRIVIEKLVKTDEVAPWNPNEFVYKSLSRSETKGSANTYKEMFEIITAQIPESGEYRISITNTEQSHLSGKSFRFEKE